MGLAAPVAAALRRPSTAGHAGPAGLYAVGIDSRIDRSRAPPNQQNTAKRRRANPNALRVAGMAEASPPRQEVDGEVLPERASAAAIAERLDERLPPLLLSSGRWEEHRDRARGERLAKFFVELRRPPNLHPCLFDPRRDVGKWRIAPDAAPPRLRQSVIGPGEELVGQVRLCAGGNVEIPPRHARSAAAPCVGVSRGETLIAVNRWIDSRLREHVALSRAHFVRSSTRISTAYSFGLPRSCA